MNHTLIVPTYNRPEHLKRLIHYYRARCPSMNFLVLDSSKPEIARDNAETVSLLGMSARHVVYPGTTPMAAKLAHGLELVETQYASFCADDDLVFPAGLKQAAEFLNNHPDYVSAHGLYLNFQRIGNEIHFMSEYAGPGNEAGHPGARIFRLFQKYESLFYAVFRTKDLRDILSAVSALPTLHYQELFQSVAALVKGKVKRFQTLYAGRQSCDPAEPGRDKWQTYYWFADDPTELLRHYRAYCGELWKFYDTHGPAPRLDRAAFFKVLDLAHTVYFSAGCPPRYFYEKLQLLWPDDNYLEAGRMDLMDGLGRPRGMPKRQLCWQLDSHVLQIPPTQKYPWSLAFWYGWLALRAAPRLLLIDRQAAQTCATAWKCKLPLDLRWLASTPEFQRAYFEFCFYLDLDER
jgi:glycosyltransferase domain-containing protein